MNKAVGICFIIFLTFFSTGCSSIIKAEQPAVFDSVAVTESNSVGQSFLASFDGLNGIEIYLDTLNNGRGEILVTLRENPQSQNISQVTIPLEDISTTGFFHIHFPVQANSNQLSYYLLLRVKDGGSLDIGTAPGNTYLNGALYQDGKPDDQHQMTFQLSYDNSRLLLGLMKELLLWVWYLLIAIFLFVLPGWALLNLFWSPYQQHSDETDIITKSLHNPISKLAIAIGTSIAIYPIFFLWTDLIGAHLGIWYAWVPPIIGSVFLVWQFAQQYKKRVFTIKLPTVQIVDGALFIIILLIIFTRFWAIRSLPLPLWGDSYHHTMITQLMIDNQGLFNSWQPYADAITFTYHFGFHTLSTIFHWITNVSAAQATMIVGQIINIAAVLTLYPLALLIFKNKWSGVIALLVAGLLSPMPMFYVNWGRYTQLAGQVFLIVAVWSTWIIFNIDRREWRLLLLTWMVISSLAMTHYRVIIFYLMFLTAYLILHIRKRTYRHIIIKIFWIGIGAGILFLPWFINVFGGRIISLFTNLATNTTVPTNGSGNNVISYSVGDLTNYLSIGIWVLVIFILAICIWQRKVMIVTVSLWWFLIFLLANPDWFHLPGKGIIDNFAVFIAVYIPAGIILASIPVLFSSKRNLDPGNLIWTKIALGGILIVFSFRGAWQRHQDVDPLTFALAATPDIQAATWIKENVTTESRFLVNSFFAFNDSVVVGSDGGWWLPLIAERQSTLPPITYAFEKEPIPDYSKWVQVPARMIETYGITHPTTLETFKEFGVTHIYIGQQQGSVNYSGPLRLNPAELSNDSHFNPIYHQDRVWIFEFAP